MSLESISLADDAMAFLETTRHGVRIRRVETRGAAVEVPPSSFNSATANLLVLDSFGIDTNEKSLQFGIEDREKGQLRAHVRRDLGAVTLDHTTRLAFDKDIFEIYHSLSGFKIEIPELVVLDHRSSGMTTSNAADATSVTESIAAHHLRNARNNNCARTTRHLTSLAYLAGVIPIRYEGSVDAEAEIWRILNSPIPRSVGTIR